MDFIKINKIIIKNLFGKNNINMVLNDDNLSIIYGANGIGKTTIIKILDCILNSEKSKLEKYNDFYKLFEINFYKIEIVFNNEAKITLINKKFGNNFYSGESNYENESIIFKYNMESFKVKNPRYEKISNTMDFINEHYQKIEKLFPNDKFYFLNVNRTRSSDYRDDKYDKSKDGVYYDFAKKIEKLRSSNDYNKDEITESLEKLNLDFLTICEGKEYKKINLESESVLLNNKSFNISKLSTGELNLLHILFVVKVIAKDNSIVFIDEPEISLHLLWQREISRLILDTINNKKIQVIMASHSPFVALGNSKFLINMAKSE